MSTFPQAQSHEPEGKSTFLQAHSSEPGGKLTFLRGHQRWDRVPSGNSEFKCQHSQFTYSLLIKRKITIFERAPLPKPGIEPKTLHIKGEHLTRWAFHPSLKSGVHLFIYIVNAAMALRSRCMHQGYNSIGWLLKTFFWKIAGLRPAIFSGTPRNFQYWTC